MLLLCLTSILQTVWLGRLYQEYKLQPVIAFRVIEVLNPPPPHEKVTAHGGTMLEYSTSRNIFTITRSHF